MCREEKYRGEKMKCLKHCPSPNEEVPQNPKGVNRLLDFQHEPRETSMTQVQVCNRVPVRCAGLISKYRGLLLQLLCGVFRQRS
jgi:hypothetical protein